MPWNHILISDVAQDDPITEGLLEDIVDNQEALLESQVDVQFDTQLTTSETYDNVVDQYLWIPYQLANSPSTWQLTIGFETQRGGGSASYDYRWRFNGGSWTEVTGLDHSGWAERTIVIADADLKVAALVSEVKLEIDMRIDSIYTAQIRSLYKGDGTRLVRI